MISPYMLCCTVELPQSITTNIGLQSLLLFLRELPQKEKQGAMWYLPQSHLHLAADIPTTTLVQRSKSLLHILLFLGRTWDCQRGRESRSASTPNGTWQSASICHSAHSITVHPLSLQTPAGDHESSARSRAVSIRFVPQTHNLSAETIQTAKSRSFLERSFETLQRHQTPTVPIPQNRGFAARD